MGDEDNEGSYTQHTLPYTASCKVDNTILGSIGLFTSEKRDKRCGLKLTCLLSLKSLSTAYIILPPSTHNIFRAIHIVRGYWSEMPY